mgnify:CR=1 FL=1
MNIELMNLFAEFMEKQEILSKLTEDKKLHGFNYSEVHTIAAIGKLSDPNVTEIANYLNVTRGAISKIAKKLLNQKMIESYQRDDNKQKIFFRLTTLGKVIFDEHEKRHSLWLQRDNAFLEKIDSEKLELIQKFMKEFNEYLEIQIKRLEKTDEN